MDDCRICDGDGKIWNNADKTSNMYHRCPACETRKKFEDVIVALETGEVSLEDIPEELFQRLEEVIGI